jgi:hypothetical protein
VGRDHSLWSQTSPPVTRGNAKKVAALSRVGQEIDMMFAGSMEGKMSRLDISFTGVLYLQTSPRRAPFAYNKPAG